MEGEIILESIFWAASNIPGIVFSSVQSLSRVRLFATPWTTACQASLSITNSCSPSKPMSIESVMPSNYLILCCPPSPPALNLSQHQDLFRWVSSSYQVAKVLEFQRQHQSYQGLISFRMDWWHCFRCLHSISKQSRPISLSLGSLYSNPLIA